MAVRKQKKQRRWPVLKTYDGNHLDKIAMPIGGIGTGTISLGGRGDLRDWEIVNRPAKGFNPVNSCFTIYAKPAGGEAVTRLLEGPVPVGLYEGADGSIARNHGLPRFERAEFRAAYPLGQVLLEDDGVPVRVRMEAFNPLVPGDVAASAYPAMVVRFVIENRTNKSVTAAVCGTMLNFIGTDGTIKKTPEVTNVKRSSDNVRGVFMSSDLAAADPFFGTMALATTSPNASIKPTWPNIGWSGGLLHWWTEFSTTGRVKPTDPDIRDAGPKAWPVGSVSAGVNLPPRGEKSVTFVIAWHFPNRLTWTPGEGGHGKFLDSGKCEMGEPIIGNHYTTQFDDAWAAAEKLASNLPDLESRTLDFVEAFVDSDIPDPVKEAALFNLSTLRTQTCFRTPDGRFFGWEGVFDIYGSCFGSCTHVWNYEQTTAFMFGSLARSMREVEFAYATQEGGEMNFRVSLPLEKYRKNMFLAAADGQMGCLMKLYRDWQLSGDDAMLRSLWPHAKRALEFCWTPGGWDADRDGVMEGCQHNTMDVEYYGPNPEMGSWYLGALRAMEEMARHVGEESFADECRRLFESGRKFMDEKLFNGQYYEHHVRPITDPAKIGKWLKSSMGAQDLSDPEFQLGAGCLADQLVGQAMAHVCGLGYLLDPKHVKKTLASLMKYNFRRTLPGHFNHMRSYALADEAGLLVATYPLGRRPRLPFPYCNEVWTGLEYTAAAGMLFEGGSLAKDGLTVIQAVRQRYDGRKRSPFDEAECGHHYARAMAAWAGVLAWTGFHFSAVTRTMAFNASKKTAIWFWSTGDAWGTIRQSRKGGGVAIELRVLHGELELETLKLTGHGEIRFPRPLNLRRGQTHRATIQASRSRR